MAKLTIKILAQDSLPEGSKIKQNTRNVDLEFYLRGYMVSFTIGVTNNNENEEFQILYESVGQPHPLESAMEVFHGADYYDLEGFIGEEGTDELKKLHVELKSRAEIWAEDELDDHLDLFESGGYDIDDYPYLYLGF